MSPAAVARGRAGVELRSARLTSPVLVGRQRELELLIDAALAPPAVVVIEGEAGVGKTRLVEEFLHRPEVAGRCALVGHCQPLREPFPFGPVLDALRGAARVPLARDLGRVAGALRPLLPELSALPPALEPLGNAWAERHRNFRAVAEVLGALGPAVCVLEDVHWSDDLTGDLLRYLVSELPGQVCLVLTYRPEDLSSSSALVDLTSRVHAGITRRRIRLLPLGPGEVRELATSILAIDDVSPELALDLHERTLGLPFAIEEVVNVLADHRDLVERGGPRAQRLLDELDVPVAVQDFTLGRLAQLSADAQRITRAAAVVESLASVALLRRVSGLPSRRAVAALAEALARGLLREDGDGRVAVRHSLAQRVIYEAIETPARRLLHLSAAQGIEAGDDERSLAQIAHHCKHAGRPKQWLRYAEEAADLAVSLGNDSAACDLLIQALDHPEVPAAARARLAVKLGRAALGCLDDGRALTVLRRVVDEHGLPPGVRGEVRLYVGLLLDNQAGQASDGLAEIARAVPELRHRPGLAARAMSALAVPMAMTGHVSEHLAWMHQALDAAERAGDPALKTAVLVNRATVLMHVGDPQAPRAVLEVPEHAASAEERRQLLRANVNLAHACTCTGQYEQAESFLGRARALLADASDPYLAVAHESTSVLLDYLRGRWTGLSGQAEQLRRAGEEAPLVVAEVELALGLLFVAQGQLLGAKTHLHAAHALGSTGGSVPVVAAADGGLARLAFASGDVEAAAARALAGLELVAGKGVWVWAAELAPVAVRALIASERRSEAVRVVRELATGLRGRNAPAAKAALGTCRAHLAASQDAERAARAFRRAELLWTALPRPYDAAQCREARAEALLTGGAEDRGKEVLFSALEAYKAIGATWDGARVRRSLREHGVTRPWRGGRKGYGTALSPREREVLGLAAMGRTNREIAEELVLSPRTVESHLAKAMRKLGVHSRRALTPQPA